MKTPKSWQNQSEEWFTMDQGWVRSQGPQGCCKCIPSQDPMADALSQSPCLDSQLAHFLETLNNAWAIASSILFPSCRLKGNSPAVLGRAAAVEGSEDQDVQMMLKK